MLPFTIHGINSQLCMLHSFKVSVNIQIQWPILRDFYPVDLGWMADTIFFVKFPSDSGKITFSYLLLCAWIHNWDVLSTDMPQ